MTHSDINATSQKSAPELRGPSLSFSNPQPGMILPAQVRAARGLLNWGRDECARAANLSPETIKNIEHGVFKPTDVTREYLLQAFTAHGVEFLNLINFRMHTASGNDLNMVANVVGAMLVIPAPQQSSNTEKQS